MAANIRIKHTNAEDIDMFSNPKIQHKPIAVSAIAANIRIKHTNAEDIDMFSNP